MPLIGISFTSVFVLCSTSTDISSYLSLFSQGLASRGVGAITVEATAVVPEGRIAPEDMVLRHELQ